MFWRFINGNGQRRVNSGLKCLSNPSSTGLWQARSTSTTKNVVLLQEAKQRLSLLCVKTLTSSSKLKPRPLRHSWCLSYPLPLVHNPGPQRVKYQEIQSVWLFMMRSCVMVLHLYCKDILSGLLRGQNYFEDTRHSCFLSQLVSVSHYLFPN